MGSPLLIALLHRSLAALSGEFSKDTRHREIARSRAGIFRLSAPNFNGAATRVTSGGNNSGGEGETCAIPTLAGSLCVARHGSPIKIHCVYIFRSWPLPPPSPPFRSSLYALSLPRAAACHSVKSLLFAGRVRDRRISLFQRNQRGPGALLPRPAG